MKIPEIKKLVENYTIDELIAAEKSISEEREPLITVGGVDDGEKLTHAYAAIQVKQEMEKGSDFKSALRAYTARVRSSIN